MMKHIVMTPMNWKLYDNCTTEQADEWFRHRIELFKEYNVPSIKSQTCRNFKWFLYIDPKTPNEHLDMILNAIKHPSFLDVTVFVYGWWADRNNTIEALRNINKKLPTWLISTRFDNDDCMRSTLVETVQDYFNAHKTEEVINFRTNYKIDHLEGYGSEWHAEKPNSFISLIERVHSAKKIKLVNSSSHSDASQIARVYTIQTHPMFAMVCHDMNKVNKFVRINPRKYVTIDKIKKDFWG